MGTYVLRREDEYVGMQEGDGDGGAGEKKERKTNAEVDGYHRERLVGERIIKGGQARPG